MKKIDIPAVWSVMKATLTKYSPGILTGTGIAGMIAATVLAVKATPKAMERIEAYKKEHKHKKLTVKQTVEAAWKCYIPAAVTCGASVGCLIGGNQISGRRTAALAAAYNLSETALKEYKEKVVETIGEKKEKSVREAIAKDHLDEHQVGTHTVIMTGGTDVLCWDEVSKREFYSTKDKILRAVNEVNRRLRDEMFVSLNDFYDEIGLERMKSDPGDIVGWDIDKGYLDVSFYTQLGKDDVTPCLVVDYNVVPRYK